MYLLASITLRATSAGSGATAGLPAPTNPVARYGAPEAVELQFAHRCGLDGFLDRGVDARPDEYLAGRGSRAQPRGEVRNRPDRAVVVSPLEADPAQRCVSGLDPDPETE